MMTQDVAIRDIAMDDIDEPQHIARSNIDDAALVELAESIQRIGLINPITVRPVGNRYEIVAGHRRYLAHRILGRQTIMARIVEASENEAETMKVVENIQREQLTYAEEIHNIRYMRDVMGMDTKQIASMTGRSIRWVQQRLDALQWPEQVIEAVSAGQISAGAARKLMQVDDPDYRQYLMDCAIRNGATEWTVTGWVQAWEVSKLQAPIEEIEVAPRRDDRVQYKVVIPCYACRQELPVEQMHIVRICDRCKAAIDEIRDQQ